MIPLVCPLFVPQEALNLNDVFLFSYVLQTANPNVCIHSFSFSTDKVVTKILSLLCPHIELSPSTDPFLILLIIFLAPTTLFKVSFTFILMIFNPSLFLLFMSMTSLKTLSFFKLLHFLFLLNSSSLFFPFSYFHILFLTPPPIGKFTQNLSNKFYR